MASNLSHDQFLESQREIANQFLSKLNNVPKPGPVAIAIEMISRRLVESGNSLDILYRNSPHDWAFDGGSILRTNYDLMLQGLYIMADPAKWDERAQLYLDFMKVERKNRIDLMDSSVTDIAKHFSNSPKRTEVEPEILKQFDAVKAKFMTKKGKLRKNWYPGSLRELAKASGLEPEYELMQRFLSGVVHSSPLTLEEGPLVRDVFLMNWYWRFAFRILGKYAEYKGVALDEMEKALIDNARKNVFDGLSP